MSDSRSRFGVVILSPAFFAKDWPQWELEALVAKENAEGRKVILTVWHGITLQDLVRVRADSSSTARNEHTERVAGDLIRALEREQDDVPREVVNKTMFLEKY